jgi:hydroxymethylpyrimidine/phosphomethylpyrimidine kinase
MGLQSLKKQRKIPIALTIAGSDSGGGAGIQADLKTFAALGVYGTSAVTAVTAQNTRDVTAITELSPEMVAAQIDAVVSDIGVDAAKTGMLSSKDLIEIVAEEVHKHHIKKLVVDPVMVAKSGAALLEESAVDALLENLLPFALVVTPNWPEAEKLVGHKIQDDEEARDACRKIAMMGPKVVVLKGGHREGKAVDLVFDGKTYTRLSAERVQTTSTHGTGCTFSAAIAAGLAKGLEPLAAIRAAKKYVTSAIQKAYPVGHGHGPVNHFYQGIRA